MQRLVIAITGASGAMYGIRALEMLQTRNDIETHLILSPSGMRTIKEETDYSPQDVMNIASQCHPFKDIGASLSSGSFKTMGMLVAPCSIKTLSGIANSYDTELVVRAADVCLKERRPVVLMVRETPLHAGHLRLMAQATENGAIIAPPVPGFYSHPTSIAELIDQTVGRALDLFDINLPEVVRWREEALSTC